MLLIAFGALSCSKEDIKKLEGRCYRLRKRQQRYALKELGGICLR